MELAWLLPKVPSWKFVHLPADPSYPMKAPVHLFYWDTIEVLQHILKSPLVQDYLHFALMRIFKAADKMMRIYESWLSSDRAWDMQVHQTFPFQINSSNYYSEQITSGCDDYWYDSVLG